jgi:hypothetical protein
MRHTPIKPTYSVYGRLSVRGEGGLCQGEGLYICIKPTFFMCMVCIKPTLSMVHMCIKPTLSMLR